MGAIEPSSQPGKAPPERRGAVGSERFGLARLARDAALRVPGVAGTDVGPSGAFVTVSGDERLRGVTCVATREGGYEVSLRLVGEPVSLPALADRVTAAVRRVASGAGIAVESVNVHFSELIGL